MIDARLRSMPTPELMEKARLLIRLGHQQPKETPRELATLLVAEAATMIWIADELGDRGKSGEGAAK